jgi:hypothetical protein
LFHGLILEPTVAAETTSEAATLSLDQEKAGGRYAAGLVLQLPARGSGSIALRSVDLIGSTGCLFDAIAHGYEVAILT